MVRNIRFRINNAQSHHLKDVSEDKNIVLAPRQPRNMLQTLTNADFHSNNSLQVIKNCFKCSDKRCKVWKLYLDQYDS